MAGNVCGDTCRALGSSLQPAHDMRFGVYSQPAGFFNAKPHAPDVFADEQLMKDCELLGTFWCASSPKRKFSGQLKFNAGLGIRVEVAGNVLKPGGPSLAQNIGTIHGRLHDGEPISLLDCQAHIAEVYRESVYTISTIESKAMIRGIQLESSGQNDFVEMHASFSHLDHWFGPPFEVTHEDSYATSKISFENPEITCPFDYNGVNAVLKVYCSRKFPLTEWEDSLAWQYRYQCAIVTKEGHPLDWFLGAISALRDMFILLIGTGVHTLALAAKTTTARDSEPDARIILPVAFPRLVRLDVNYMSSRFEDLQHRFPSIVKCWFENRKTFDVAVRAYTELQCSDGLSTHYVILRILQTLEHLYSLVLPNQDKYMNKSLFTQFRRWIASNSPAELPEATEDDLELLRRNLPMVVERMAVLNSFSFRDRLRKLIREIDDGYLYPIFGSPHDIEPTVDEFVSLMAATRNFLTHFSSESEVKSARGGSLEEATSRCWAVLTYWLIHKAGGVGPEESGSVALKARKAMFTVSRNSSL